MIVALQLRTMVVRAPLKGRASSEDNALIARVGRGERMAFNALFDKYKNALASFAQRITRRPDLTDDIVNETMLVVWQTASRFEGRAKPSTWIFGIAYRTALSQMRRHRSRAEDIPLDDPEASDVGYDDTEDLADKDAARRALDVLTPEQRAVVELTHYFGYSTAEIAAILSIPQGTVKTRMFAGRRRMQAFLEGTL